MAKYIMKKMADGMYGDGEKLFPQLLSSGVADINDIAEMLERRTSFTRGDVAGVLMELANVIEETLSAGRTVKIKGLGTFRAILGLVDEAERKEWTDSADRLTTGRNVKLKTVNFRPDGHLLYHVEQDMTLERKGNITTHPKPTTTLAERTTMAREYIAEHGFMRVSDYAALVGLSKSTASLELRQLAADETSGIAASGARAGKVYVCRR